MNATERSWERIDELNDAEALSAISEYCWLQLAHIMEQQRVYAGLYGDERRVEIMNAASRSVSRIVNDALFDSIVLGICRLLDPARSGRTQFENLSFDLMISKLPASDANAQFKQRRADLCVRAFSLRQRRDKHLAHTDLASLDPEARVGWVSLAEIKATLNDMGLLLADIYARAFDTHLVVWPPDDHPELPFLRILFFGKAAHDERLKAHIQELISAPASRKRRLPDLDTIYPAWLRSPEADRD